MVISVNLHFLPNYCSGQKKIELELPEGANVRAMLKALDIPAGETGVILMNKKHAVFADKLENGVHMDIYPIVAGG